jgi:hypothetical protein
VEKAARAYLASGKTYWRNSRESATLQAMCQSPAVIIKRKNAGSRLLFLWHSDSWVADLIFLRTSHFQPCHLFRDQWTCASPTLRKRA